MTESYLQNLVKYIKKNLSKGYTTDSLKWALLSQGYSRTEIERAIKIANEELAKELPKIKEKPIINVERYPIEEEAEKKSLWQKFKEFFS